MTKIGIKSSQIESMKLLHEVYIVGIGFVVWLGINWLLTVRGEAVVRAKCLPITG